MSSASPMGELRSLMHQPPHDARAQLFKLFGDWPDPQELLEVALPYCLDLIDRLPKDDLFAPPRGFMDRLIQSGAGPHAAAQLAIIPSAHITRPRNAPRGLYTLEQPPTQLRTFAWRALTIGDITPSEALMEWLAELKLPLCRLLNVLSWIPAHNKQPERDAALIDLLIKAPWLSQLEHLGVHGAAHLGGLNHLLLESLYMRETPLPLKSIDLSSARNLDPAMFKALFHSEHVRHVNSIDLSDCYISSDSLGDLISSPTLQRVTQLNLRYNWDLREEDINDLRQAPWCEAQIDGDHYESIWE